jgi:hypothetical protein
MRAVQIVYREEHMKYEVSAAHVRRQRRNAVWAVLFFAALSAGCVASLVHAAKVSSMIFPALGIYLFGQGLWYAFKKTREDASSYPIVELDENAGTLAVSHLKLTVTMPLDQIKGLRLQYKSEELRSVLAETTSSGPVRLEGYEHLEELAGALKKYVATESIKRATFYHR